MRERHRKILYLLFNSPNGCNSQVWIRLKPGARHSSLVPHVRCRGLSMCTIICCFFGMLAGIWTGSRLAGTQNGTLLTGLQVHKWQFIQLCHSTGLLMCFLFILKYFIYLKGRATERKREEEIFHLNLQSPNGFKSQGWARGWPSLNQESRTPFWTPRWVAGTQALESYLAVFPGALVES